MMRLVRENLALKLISLATAIMIWSYAVSDRAGAPTRQVMATVVLTGEPPRGLEVEVRNTTVPVEVAGPRAQLDGLSDGAIKAVVDLTTARPGARALRVMRFVVPPEAPGLTFPAQTRFVEAVIRSTLRKRLRITTEPLPPPPSGKRFSDPVIEPAWADVEGPREYLDRVARLVVRPDVKPTGFRGQAVVDAVDRGGVSLAGVRIDPPTVHVEVAVLDMAESRLLVVSPRLRGAPPAPFVIEGVTCDPPFVTVVGLPRDLAALDAIRTVPINLEEIRADTVRQVALDVPASVTVQGGVRTVDVSIRIRDASRSEP